MNLTKLSLRGNNLSSLPSEFDKLTKLTELDLGRNDLTSLPSGFGNLTSLEQLDLHENPIADADLIHLKSITTLKNGHSSLIPTARRGNRN